MRKRYHLVALLLACLCHGKVLAASVELDFVLTFRNPVTVPHQFRTDMDCEREAGFAINDAAYLKRDLKALLGQKNISLKNRAPYQLRLYITHEDCGSNGQESYRTFPLGLGLREKDFANAYLRIISELQRKDTGEIISMHEYVAVARLEKNVSRVLLFYVAAEEKQISKRELWTPLANELAENLAADLGK